MVGNPFQKDGEITLFIIRAPLPQFLEQALFPVLRVEPFGYNHTHTEPAGQVFKTAVNIPGRRNGLYFSPDQFLPFVTSGFGIHPYSSHLQ
jgi:hypothetical protein